MSNDHKEAKTKLVTDISYDVAALDEDGSPLAGDALFDFVRERYGDTIFLQFSMGKDSVCSWLRLREYGKFKIIPYFLYWFPKLSWQLESMKYYEDWFGQEVLKLPHPKFNDNLIEEMYLAPHQIAAVRSFNLIKWDFADIESVLTTEYDLPTPTYTAVGFRGADNLDRRNLIIQKGAVGSGRRKYFFPIWDWKIDDIAKTIKQYDIKLPKDYTHWGRTIGAWDYQYIKPIKENFPEDYEQIIKFWMPLVDCEVYRHDVVNVQAEQRNNGKA